MKISFILFLFVPVVFLICACGGKGSGKKDLTTETEIVSAPDTGYTGIKKYYSKQLLIKEITFKNGIRHGEMKSYYQGGQLYQTLWYENGLREDSAKWYYLEGQVFRATPYKHDTIDGTQKQYYRNGRVKAKLTYIKGLRTPSLEEYDQKGKLVSVYPEIVASIRDDYSTKGSVRINLELSNNATKVKFYRGDFINGVFDTARVTMLKTTTGKAFLDLKKTGSPQSEYVGVIAEILTSFGNIYLACKKVDLPYKDLK